MANDQTMLSFSEIILLNFKKRQILDKYNACREPLQLGQNNTNQDSFGDYGNDLDLFIPGIVGKPNTEYNRPEDVKALADIATRVDEIVAEFEK